MSANGASDVRSVTVAILVRIALGNGLAPDGAALKVYVLDIDTCINNVHGNTLASSLVVGVFVVCTEGQRITVGESRKAPGCIALQLAGIDDRVALDVGDLTCGGTELVASAKFHVTGCQISAPQFPSFKEMRYLVRSPNLLQHAWGESA